MIRRSGRAAAALDIVYFKEDPEHKNRSNHFDILTNSGFLSLRFTNSKNVCSVLTFTFCVSGIFILHNIHHEAEQLVFITCVESPHQSKASFGYDPECQAWHVHMSMCYCLFILDYDQHGNVWPPHSSSYGPGRLAVHCRCQHHGVPASSHHHLIYRILEVSFCQDKLLRNFKGPQFPLMFGV